MSRVRRIINDALEFNDDRGHLGLTMATIILTLVSLNVIAMILETEPACATYMPQLQMFDKISVYIFTFEYAVRLWACRENKRFARPFLGQLAYAVTFFALVDLISILPFYLPFVISYDLRFMRILRFLRVFRLLKTSRYFSAFHLIAAVIKAKKEELLISVFAVMILLVFASCMMYELEHVAQPEAFGSIPAAMWWGVVTLTTVGYGDVFPITVAGKICAAAMAILSMGMVALPAGILASGFMEEMHSKRIRSKQAICPHCGNSV